MLWYKAWLDTRWRFTIGLVVLVLVASGTAFDWLATSAVPSRAKDAIDTSTMIGRRLKDAVDIARTYRGHVWLQWFKQNLAQIGTLFAVLLGSGGVVTGGSGNAALFTLSMPTSRARLIGARAGIGLVELLAMIVVSSLVIPAMAPTVGQYYALGDTVVHCVCVFAGAAAFFGVALLLSTAFDDLWPPLLLTCVLAVMLAGLEFLLPDEASYGLFHLMSGETYFRTGRVPWASMIVSAIASAGLIGAAAVNLGRRDF